MSDKLIVNGSIIDGSGKESFNGHIYIHNDKIKSVVRSNTLEAEQLVNKGASEVFNAKGLTVSPGFIDCHTHFDWVFPLANHPDFLFPMVEQGVTTVISGNCGFSPFPITNDTKQLVSESVRLLLEKPLSFSWKGLDEFLKHLEQNGGLLLNNVQLAGHGTVQSVITRSLNEQPTVPQMKEMESIIENSFDQGAYGLSLGLMYPPGIFSTQENLKAMAQITAKKGRVLAAHIKALSKYSVSYPIIPFIGKAHNLKAIDEILSLALETGVKLQISHLIFAGAKSWSTGKKLIKRIEKAKDKGADVMFDIYAVYCGNSYLTVFLPGWFLKNLDKNLDNPKLVKKVKTELKMAMFLLGFKLSDIQIMKANYPEGEKYNGLNLVEIAEKVGREPLDIMLEMIRKSEGQTLQVTYGYSGDENNEGLMEMLMAHPLCLFETDTLLLSKGFPNPASYGNFPRILGHFVRDKKALTLVDAIHRMTGKTAQWFGIKERGEIKPGNFADITIFNPETIADNTTIKHTAQKPSGIEKVFINGEIVVMDGFYLKGRKKGAVLRCE